MKYSSSVFIAAATAVLVMALLNCNHNTDSPRKTSAANLGANQAGDGQGGAGSVQSHIDSGFQDSETEDGLSTTQIQSMSATVAASSMSDVSSTAMAAVSTANPSLYSVVKKEVFDKNCSGCHKTELK